MGRGPPWRAHQEAEIERGGALRIHLRAAVASVTLLLLAVPPCFAWQSWGGDPGGSRFSPLREISPGNVGQLVRAFEYHTGDLTARAPELMRRTKFQATPLFVEGSLIFCTPFNEVIALDPGTGVQKWRYDPKIATNQRPANRFVCRGVTYWVDDTAPPDAACRARIFMGTNDVRLIALDAKTGVPCAGFGNGGEIKLDTGMPLEWPGEFQITSPPAVGRGVVVVGSAIGDNRRVDAERPGACVRCANRPATLDLRAAQARWHRSRSRQCLGADVGRRQARIRVPADVVALAGFLGRQAAGQ